MRRGRGGRRRRRKISEGMEEEREGKGDSERGIRYAFIHQLMTLVTPAGPLTCRSGLDDDLITGRGRRRHPASPPSGDGRVSPSEFPAVRAPFAPLRAPFSIAASFASKTGICTSIFLNGGRT